MIAYAEVFKLPPTAKRSVGAFIAIADDVGGYGQLEMLPQHLRPMVLLHELAHVCAKARYDSHAHDPWFARTYLDLVFHALGWDKWMALRHAFDDGGIDYVADTSSGSAIAL